MYFQESNITIVKDYKLLIISLCLNLYTYKEKEVINKVKINQKHFFLEIMKESRGKFDFDDQSNRRTDIKFRS